MLKLEKIEDKVYYNGKELKINKQASKGPGNEVVYIKDCPEANGQTWISLKRLNDGMNEIECKAREITTNGKYTLTEEEQDRINELQAEIDSIKEAAKARYVERPNLKLDYSKLTAEQKQAEIDKVQKYIEFLRNN